MRFYRCLSWRKGQWALRPLPLLTGDGLATAHRSPVAARSSYPELRRELRDRLKLTEEGQRRQFREIRWEEGTRHGPSYDGRRRTMAAYG